MKRHPVKRVKQFPAISFSRLAYGFVAIAVFAGIGTYVLGLSHAAGNATLSLSPGSSTLALGATVTVSIIENSGSVPVNAVQADLNYDQTKLQFVSVSTSTSPFSLVVQATGGSGVVNVASATSTAQTGQQTVAVMTFTAIGAGSAAVSFANTSSIVQASDGTDVTGTLSGATYTIADQTAPTVPAGLAAGTRTATTIPLTWTASTDNVAVTGYKVYRNGTQVGTTASASYTDTGLTPNTSYSYSIAAYDATGNISAQSSATSFSTTPDTTAPSVPAGLAMNTHTLTSIKLTWTASTDNVGVSGYKVYRNGTQIATSQATNYTDTGLTPGTSYSYTVAAYDAANNTSAQSTASSFSTLADTTAPSVPANLNSTGQTTTSIALSWSSSTDDVAVTGYKVYRNGTQIATTASTTYTNTGLTPGTSYSYTVAAYDASGNTSAQSSAKSVSTTLVTGDDNGDGHVNIQDLSVLAATWLSTTDLRADFNHDGVVNIVDLSILASNWGK
jgi:chitodextrinase